MNKYKVVRFVIVFVLNYLTIRLMLKMFSDKFYHEHFCLTWLIIFVPLMLFSTAYHSFCEILFSYLSQKELKNK